MNRTKIMSLLLSASLLLTACSKGKNQDSVKEKISTYTIEQLVNHPELKDEHQLDEILKEIGYEGESGIQTLKVLEEQYKNAIEEKKYKEADCIVAKIIKLVISAKLSELTQLDAQSILNSIDIPMLSDKKIVTFLGESYRVLEYDNDQFNRLVINYANAVLTSNYDYNRPGYPESRYSATKEAIFTNLELKKTTLFDSEANYVISSDFDETKINKLRK